MLRRYALRDNNDKSEGERELDCAREYRLTFDNSAENESIERSGDEGFAWWWWKFGVWEG